MADLTADSQTSYMDFGGDATTREQTMATPATTDVPGGEEETPRRREMGSMSSVGFHPDNLQQLSSTQIETLDEPAAQLSHAPSLHTSMPPEELEESSDGLKAALMNDSLGNLTALIMKMDAKLTADNAKLRADMKDMKNDTAEMKKDVKNDNLKLRESIDAMETKLNKKLEIQSAEIRMVTAQLDGSLVRINRRFDQIPEVIKKEVDILRTEVQKDLNAKVEEIQNNAETHRQDMKKELEERFRKSENKQKTECDMIRTQLEQSIDTAKQQLKLTVTEMGSKLDKTIEMQNTEHAQINSLTDTHAQLEKKCDSMEGRLHAVSIEVKDELELQKVKMSQLETKINCARNSGEVTVIPDVQSVTQLFNGLGKFDDSDRYMRPKPFIEQLRVIQDLAPTPWPLWRFRLSSLLMEGPLLFLHSRAHEFQSLEDFIKAFLEQYWSISRQQSLLSEIISCQYHNMTNMTCTTFVAKILYLNSQLDDPIPDLTLANITMKKLPYNIQMALATSPIKSFRDLENYLHCVQSVAGNKYNNNNTNNRNGGQYSPTGPPPVSAEENRISSTNESMQVVELVESPPPHSSYNNERGNKFNYNRGRNNRFQNQNYHYDGRDRLNQNDHQSTPKSTPYNSPSSSSNDKMNEQRTPPSAANIPSGSGNQQGSHQNNNNTSKNKA